MQAFELYFDFIFATGETNMNPSNIGMGFAQVNSFDAH
jgi:hypothetical protein